MYTFLKIVLAIPKLLWYYAAENEKLSPKRKGRAKPFGEGNKPKATRSSGRHGQPKGNT
jgi:hypothetical protein